MYKDPTEFRNRFKRWKETGEYSLPRFFMGTEGSGVEYDDETYKKFHWAINDENEYLSLVSKGYPEKKALKYVKDAVKSFPNNYYINGPTLPDVVVKPNPNSTSTALLTTYYPWSTDFPITGHSTLELIHPNSDDGSTAYITAYGDDPWYNFVTNNCSDSTREAIENATGKKINPVLFTTPGDVKDFVESQLGGSSKKFDDGSIETVFTIPTKLARKIVDYAHKQTRLRYLSRNAKSER